MTIQPSIVREGTPLAYAQRDWLRGPLASGTQSVVAHSADNAYIHMLSLPAATVHRAVIKSVNASIELALKFYGLGADNSTYTSKVWGVKRLKHGAYEEYLGDHLLSGTHTLGTGLAAGSNILPVAARWADTVTWGTDQTITPGVLTMADSAQGAIISIIDHSPGYFAYIVEVGLTEAQATGAGFLYSV